MKTFAVIDTETNWNDEAMSIGLVIAQADSLEIITSKYYIISPEYVVGGMYSSSLRTPIDFKCETLELDRKATIDDLTRCLKENNTSKIFAYNAAFDYRHLPELKDFEWFDITRVAAYRQYNKKIGDAECNSTGRLKRNYSVASIKKMLTGLEGERHCAIHDAMDELNYIIKPLCVNIDNYPPYEQKAASAPRKTRKAKRIKDSFALTTCNQNDIQRIENPIRLDLIGSIYDLKKNKNNYLLLERFPARGSLDFVKVTEYENNNVSVYLKFKYNNQLLTIRKKMPCNSELVFFLLDFEKGDYSIENFSIVN